MGTPSDGVGFESAETVWFRVYVEACRRGLGTALVSRVVVLGDGAARIWHYAAAFLGVKLTAIVDISHAFEHLENARVSEEVREAIGDFTTNAARLDDPRVVALKLPIGAGAVESRCRTVMPEREKGAGMRWTEKGAQAVASRRARQKSGRWPEFWKTPPQRRRPTVLHCRKTNVQALAGTAKQAAWHHS